ncbi:hypothetical protein AAV99_11705 [Aurantiacibacter marinus]|uniref:Uncharacterized protein n=1 Tax=Aurantiacibacter marinus TaxID=874156 RepID=A0A0H0XL78_9SPHN|nr:hypothetical protein AAV99_11705 [Aurantiacibacter marinus]
MPASLAGLGCMFAAIIAIIAQIISGQWIADSHGSKVPLILSLGVAATVAIAFMRFAKNHS